MAKRVLAVSDERHILRLVQVNLERQGYLVLAAGDMDGAIEIARREQPDLVVVDFWFRALKDRLRDDPATAHINVLVLDRPNLRPTGG